MRTELRRTSPEKQGVSSRKVLKLLQDIDRTENELHGFMLAVNDSVIAEGWRKPFSADIPHCCHSLGKSYTCTAVGIACTEGLLDPDDRVVDLFADDIRKFGIHVKPGFEKLKLRHLMSMSTGMPSMPMMDDAWERNFLSSGIQYEPGTHFLYNSTGSCMLGAAVEKVTGKSLLGYLQDKLFDKIGIRPEDIVWQKFINGRYAEPGLCATTEANLRLGLFYLHDGCAEGEQVISKQWMHDATSLQIETSDTHKKEDDGTWGYGWQLWHGSVKGLYRFDGGQGQLCYVFPQKHCVFAVHKAGRDPENLRQFAQLVDAFLSELPDEPSELPDAPKDQEALRQYIDQLSVSDVPESAGTLDAVDWDGEYEVESGEVQPWIEVVPVDVNFWRHFYDPAVNAEVKKVSIRTAKDEVDICFNGRSMIHVRLDHQFIIFDTPNVLPGLEKTCALGWVGKDGRLHVDLHWINGWFRAEMDLENTGDGRITVDISKDMLHEYSDLVKYHGVLRRIG